MSAGAARASGVRLTPSASRVFGSFHCSNVTELLRTPRSRYQEPARPFALAPPGAPSSSHGARFGPEARGHFLLEDGFTFLNHGAFGATLRGAAESKRRWTEHIEAQPVRFLDRELFPHLVHVSRGLAELLECEPQELMPMPSATAALNTVLRSWQRRFSPGPGHRAACLSVSYGSNKKLLGRLAAETGLQVDEAAVDFPLKCAGSVLRSLEGALRADTSLVLLDAVPSNAPLVLPLEEAVAVCRRRSPNALVVVDGAHCLGGVPVSLRRPPGDIFVSNCHKWFCGPKGTAVLHVPERHQEWIEPLVISHGFGSDFASGFYWSGLSDFSSWLALDAVLAFWGGRAGLEAAQLYCRSLAGDAAGMLAEAWRTGRGFPAELTGPMALVELPHLPGLGEAGTAWRYEHAEVVQNALFQRRIEVPVKALSGRLYVRISAHIRKAPDDMCKH